ncbi:SDR family oxidoreductase [Halobacillus seohaensis]|uniref:SDR family oxidoreductase n=1 Tax=Halobacillus seohaensis TaxID=447421 RepID=A0ABW2EMM7_9BACI
MKNKIAIVTGANSGMGLATTIELAKQDIQVIMACRDQKRGEQSLSIAREQSQSNHIEMMICDLGSLESIRKFVNQFKIQYDRLNILINNAGVVSLKRQLTADGFETQMGVNHLGHFLLTNLLLEELKNAEDARVVVISSGAHKWGDIYFQDPYFEKSNYHVLKGYGQSKLANVLFTKAIAERVIDHSISVNAVHPGAVATNLGIDRDTGVGKMITSMLKPFFKTPRQGAGTAISLAVDPQFKGVTGEYFYNKEIVPISRKAKDRRLAETLWIWSEREVGIRPLLN